jgi:Predicted RNA-binding protein homologous to eukaryotic snRNP
MAFDGITIANIAQELNQTIVGGKINKIAQPENDELMITIKTTVPFTVFSSRQVLRFR